MFFRRRPTLPSPPDRNEVPERDAATELLPNPECDGRPDRKHARSCGAETAHLIGPGCLQVRGSLLRWEPVKGQPLVLHPQRLARVLLYGATDATGAALRLAFREGITVVFLSPQGHQVLGLVVNEGDAPGLTWLQHQAILNPRDRLQQARRIVEMKIQSAIEAVRYYQRQGRIPGSGNVLTRLGSLQRSGQSASTLDALRGFEGTAAQLWFRTFASLLPDGWTFPGRIAYPATDPVNSLLSLGYALLTTRCRVLLMASCLDPCTGFLHDVRPGRPSLACDLVEPFRIPVVDRLVLALLSAKRLSNESFERTPDGIRLRPDAFRTYLAAFEESLDSGRDCHRDQIQNVIDMWIQAIRRD